MNSLQKIISNTSTHSESSVEKTCPLCQKKFVPKGRQKYCDGPHFKPCPVCGKLVPAPYPSDPAKCCSSECRKKLKEGNIETKVNPVEEVKKDLESIKVEHVLDPDIELSKDKLEALDKDAKAFFTKKCIFDSNIKGLIKGHVYDIEVVKEPYTYSVSLTYDHIYREEVNISFNLASSLSFNNYFK